MMAEGFNQQQNGNVLLIVLLAVVLIGVLTAAIQSTSRPEGANIDDEALILRAGEVQRYASELERAVLYILQSGQVSEADIRFAHADAPDGYGSQDIYDGANNVNQVFAREGGGAAYRLPPEGVNDGSRWEFYGGTHVPSVGSDRPELIAVLPNVTEQFCRYINDVVRQPGIPVDSGGGQASNVNPGACVYQGENGRFSDEAQFYETANTMKEDTFALDQISEKPLTALQACVECSTGGYHFYHVILAR